MTEHNQDNQAVRMMNRHNQRRQHAPQYDDEDDFFDDTAQPHASYTPPKTQRYDQDGARDAARHTAKRQQKQSQSRPDAQKHEQSKVRQKSSRVPIILAKIGAWMVVGSFSLLLIGINGGYSVLGLEVLSTLFNDAGRIFWAAISALQIPVPVRVEGLPISQPLIPWVGVIGGSILQCVTIWMKLSHLPIPAWLWNLTIGISLYDLATTFFGLGVIAWIAEAGTIGIGLQALLAIFITFVVEVVISIMLRVK